jgi:iron(II)-dependent oxidoreductase
MDGTFQGYSKAQALRTGGVAPVRAALLETRQRTLDLADAYAGVLAPAGMEVPYAPQLNPPLWEWGHIAWFQEYWVTRNQQRSLGVRCDPSHPRAPLQPLADTWYDSSRVPHRVRWSRPLPDADATRDYLAAALDGTLQALAALPADAGDDDLYFFRLVALHEAMHAEAATYMGRALGIPIPQAQPPAPTANPVLARLSLPGQVFRLGAPEGGFAFDNELGAQDVSIEAFEIDDRPVSWARFLAFVHAGGYEQRKWWSDAGWSWLEQQSGSRRSGPEAGEAQAAAVHLSAHEAEAWCRWAGRRLPTEAQWECAALQAPGFLWGEVWEWTASSFEPYPGFGAHPYRDYSQPWFGSRRVLRGACRATSPWLAHPRYRNFFEPQRTDIFAGFRSCA